jgi:RND family efflux transporter MFP subunit
MLTSSLRVLAGLLALAGLVLVGCAGAQRGGEPRPPAVSVSQVVEGVVTDYEDFTGRTEAVSRVELRARVTGYLDRVTFKDGADVKKGEVLFEIDSRPYRAEVEKAEARLALREAGVKRAELDFRRAKALLARRAISKEEFDKLAADLEEAQAALIVARADLTATRLTLSFTKVYAPIDGRIGRRLLDAGNLVKADDTILATIVSRASMYVYFDIDERTLLRSLRAVGAGKLGAKGEIDLPVRMGLADEKGRPHRGRVDFMDNSLRPGTAALRVRAVLPNADGLLMPGLFVRVRLTTSAPFKALLVPEEAVVLGKGQASLFLVNDKSVVEERRVRLGQRHDGLRVVEEGVKAEDSVVFGGLRDLRPGMTVKPRKVDVAPKKK